MDDQRDYAEEAYNRHVMHTGDGEIEYCEDEQCPSYVPPTEREGEQELVAERAEAAGLRPETRALIAQTEAALPGQRTPEFERIREGIFDAQVCTSLSDEDATARMNELPSGTSYGWQLSTDPTLAPVPCADKPATHRHLIFEA